MSQPDDRTTETALADAIRLCGEDGFELALWDFLRRVTRADNAVVLAFRDGAPPQVLFRKESGTPAFDRLETAYLTGAFLLDPVHELHLTHAPAGVYRLADIAPDAFHRSRYYAEYLRQTTILDELSIVAYPRPGVTVAISLGRDATSGAAFAARDIDTCRRLAPVILALAGRHWARLPVASGEGHDIAATLVEALRTRHGIGLTMRQAEVALLILRGHSTLSIALRLKVARQTVKVFRRQLYRRCGISSQAELFTLLLPHLPRS